MGAGLEDLFGNERPGEPDEANGELRRALVVAAHPDDADFGAAGVSALLARAGWHVRYLVATDGSQLDVERHGMAGPVALKIKRMGLQFDEAQLEQVFAQMRTAMASKKFATDEELEAVVHTVLGQ